uniref:Uncharacterized protein n=1 Tax=Arundo donax TaxID=35708 RepID=A0A0A8ZGL0_ARUDO
MHQSHISYFRINTTSTQRTPLINGGEKSETIKHQIFTEDSYHITPVRAPTYIRLQKLYEQLLTNWQLFTLDGATIIITKHVQRITVLGGETMDREEPINHSKRSNNLRNVLGVIGSLLVFGEKKDGTQLEKDELNLN